MVGDAGAGGAIPPDLAARVGRLIGEMGSGDRTRFTAARDELMLIMEPLMPGDPARAYVMDALRRAAKDAPKSGPPPGRKRLEFHWRIRRVDGPGEAVADLVFTLYEGQERGSLDVQAPDPAMRALVYYYLADPFDHRPLYFSNAGTVSGPHTGTFGQIDRSLMMFSREHPGFRVERVSEFPPRDGCDASGGREKAEDCGGVSGAP